MTTKLTQQQRDMYNQRAKERYANRTDAQKDHDRQIDRQRYARVHPNVKPYTNLLIWRSKGSPSSNDYIKGRTSRNVIPKY